MKPDFGILFLRVSLGLLMASHGLGKAQDLFAGRTDFADPLGIGPVASLALAAFAELLCALAVAVGFKTRWAAVPVVITMLVAIFTVHADDPFSRKEKAVVYAVGFLALALTGGGRYSLDTWLGKRRRQPRIRR